MQNKYIFVDLDGTILDHSTHKVPLSTLKAFDMAKQNGHKIILATGRPPCLLYGIDKELNLNSYIAANGRVLVYEGDMVFSETIGKEVIKELLDVMEPLKIDVAFEGLHGFKLQSQFDDIYPKFSKNFSLEIPELEKDYYLDNDIYQMTLYYENDDFKKFEKMFPSLSFAYSCKYGIDVTTVGGLKEMGINALIKHLNIDPKDVIAIGDGFNDISMLKFAHTSVAMGNAHDEVKKHANIVTDDISNDGLYKAFKTLKLI